MHPYYGLIMPKSTAAAVPSIPSSFDVYAENILFNVGTEQATASFTLNSDGSCSGATYFTPGSWITPVGGSYGGSYWAKVDITSGSVTSGTTGSRVAIGSGVSWTAATTGINVLRRKWAEGTIEIWDAAAAGNMVASGSFYINGEVDNT